MFRRISFLVAAALVAVPLTATEAQAGPARPAAAPVVQRLSAYFSPVAGGVSVTITGTGFAKATAVKFGDVPASSMRVVSKTTIVATSPKHDAGPVDVRVAAGTSISAPVVADQFVYLDAMTPTAAKVEVRPVTPVICIVGSPCMGVETVTSGFDSTSPVYCRVTNSDKGPFGPVWTQGANAARSAVVLFTGSWIEVGCNGVVGRNLSWPH